MNKCHDGLYYAGEDGFRLTKGRRVDKPIVRDSDPQFRVCLRGKEGSMGCNSRRSRVTSTG